MFVEADMKAGAYGGVDCRMGCCGVKVIVYCKHDSFGNATNLRSDGGS